MGRRSVQTTRSGVYEDGSVVRLGTWRTSGNGVGEYTAKLTALHVLRLVFAPHRHQFDQVEKDQCIHDEKGDSHPGHAPEDLEDLPWKERRRDKESEELAPGFLEIKADPFGETETRIAKGHHSDAAQQGITHQRSLIEDEVDEPGLGVESQGADDLADHIPDVFADEPQCAEAYSCNEQRLDGLIGRDEQEPLVMAAAYGSFLGGRIGHGRTGWQRF